MWQWNDFISPLSTQFNIYVPDLLFFGESYTTRPERTEAFQAQCVMKTMEVFRVTKMSIVGISYGGFVGYSMVAQIPEAVEKLVMVCSGVCMEEKDMDEGMFRVKTVDEAAAKLLPQKPEDLRELMTITFYKPQQRIPTCFLRDYVDVMCTEYVQEKKELIFALHKDRKLSNLPRITHPTLIIWGDSDQVFPLELGHRLKRHLGDNAELVIVKHCGHAINIEKPKELYKHMKSFLISQFPPKGESNGNTGKED